MLFIANGLKQLFVSDSYFFTKLILSEAWKTNGIQWRMSKGNSSVPSPRRRDKIVERTLQDTSNVDWRQSKADSTTEKVQ